MSAPYHNKALPEGTILREWRLEKVLGVGGFGIVYCGKDIYFGESVAIKEYFPGAISDRIDGTTVAPTDSSSEEIYQLGRQKFMEEAKVLWNLSHPERHPNVVSVRSLFEIHGTAYMVMDFESGVSLSELLREGKRFDEAGLLAIIRPIAQGLERAHEAGVLHRDIKPANILINPEGKPVLIDFGSARFESSQATSTKVTFYTPPYAALEQYVKSYRQGPWTDIYALGVVLYQCVTGEKPPEVLERLHGEDGHLLSSRDWPGFSRAFTRAVDTAMAVRPLERPSSISSWLEMFEPGDGVPVDEPTRIASLSSTLPPSTETVRAEPPGRPKSSQAPGKVWEKDTAPKPVTIAPQRARRHASIVVAVGVASLILSVVALIAVHGHKTAAVTMQAVTQAPSAQPAASAALLPAKMDALIATAKKAGRKESEIAAFADAKAKMAGLMNGKMEMAQLVAVAGEMAKTENEILARAQRRMWRDVEALPGTNDVLGNQDAVAKLGQARVALNAALAVPAPSDPGQIIDDLCSSIERFAAFQDAYGAATPVYVAARRQAFETLHAATQSLCDQVTALANVEKPWFLASSARKNAYKLRQDNAAQAKALSARLSDLSTTVAASKDLRQLASAIEEAAAAQKTAGDLFTASHAAAL